MRSEQQKMLAGELYDPLDPILVHARDRARDLCLDLNATREAEQEERRRGEHQPLPSKRVTRRSIAPSSAAAAASRVSACTRNSR